MNTASLPAIAALVRSGAVEWAWEMFAAGGFAARLDDPAACALHGRLLKAKGRAADSPESQALFAEAARAYARAFELHPAPYLAINAASLRRLAGDAAGAAAGARRTLDLLDGPEPPADTPYFLSATRAEALLLLGDQSGAERAMAQAVAFDPDGWDDRATTVRQLREIVEAQGGDSSWIDRFMPPLSLHFAGHLGFASGGSSEAELVAQLEGLFARLRPGFAWGALATGADLIVAEMLLDAGCEVHGVLPCPAELFAQQSVAPAGSKWLARFEAVLPRCASLRIAGRNATSVHDPLATAYAGELAIGAAALNAARFQASLAQLIVFDQDGGGRNTARQAELWRADLGEQHVLRIARDSSVDALFPAEQHDPARKLVLLAAIGIDELIAADGVPTSELQSATAPIAEQLAQLPPGTVRAGQGIWEFAADDAEQGLRIISGVLRNCREAGTPLPSIGLHMAICQVFRDRASGSDVPYGEAPALARRLMHYAPRSVVLASDDLAVSLAARPKSAFRTELYLPDDADLGGPCHLLLPADQ